MIVYRFGPRDFFRLCPKHKMQLVRSDKVLISGAFMHVVGFMTSQITALNHFLIDGTESKIYQIWGFQKCGCDKIPGGSRVYGGSCFSVADLLFRFSTFYIISFHSHFTIAILVSTITLIFTQSFHH